MRWEINKEELGLGFGFARKKGERERGYILKKVNGVFGEGAAMAMGEGDN